MEILARADSGGVTHDFVNAVGELQIRSKWCPSVKATRPVATNASAVTNNLPPAATRGLGTPDMPTPT